MVNGPAFTLRFRGHHLKLLHSFWTKTLHLHVLQTPVTSSSLFPNQYLGHRYTQRFDYHNSAPLSCCIFSLPIWPLSLEVLGGGGREDQKPTTPQAGLRDGRRVGDNIKNQLWRGKRMLKEKQLCSVEGGRGPPLWRGWGDRHCGGVEGTAAALVSLCLRFLFSCFSRFAWWEMACGSFSLFGVKASPSANITEWERREIVLKERRYWNYMHIYIYLLIHT